MTAVTDKEVARTRSFLEAHDAARAFMRTREPVAVTVDDTPAVVVGANFENRYARAWAVTLWLDNGRTVTVSPLGGARVNYPATV